LAFVVGCGGKGDEDADLNSSDPQKKMAALQRQVDRLKKTDRMKDEYIRTVTRSINEIETRLDSVTRGQVSVTRVMSANPEMRMNRSQSQNMLDDISSLQTSMSRNKSQIRALRQQVSSSRFKIAELEQLVTTLTTRVADKDSQIATLVGRVSELEGTVTRQQATISQQSLTLEEQTRRSAEQQQTIEQQTRELTTGYYTYGTLDALKRKGLLVERGGFMGIGKETTIAPGYNTDLSKYSEFEIQSEARISIPHARGQSILKMLPERSSTSYQLERGASGTAIRIVNTQTFWRDKFLVVELGD
jgi:chromosome segregation ATPase